MDGEGGFLFSLIGLVNQAAMFGQLGITAYCGHVMLAVQGCIREVLAAWERKVAFLPDADGAAWVLCREMELQGRVAGKGAGVAWEWKGDF